ncbi:hypothetical protein NVP1081O_194 [Vibrio phage 1.081.O._10N.286.52.C2]|nr:hypothetical protein NVP1081O_194 [Vibrio phage 1.081.O._10N.286.52.C2]
MPSNLNKLSVKEIKSTGYSSVIFKDFLVIASSADEGLKISATAGNVVVADVTASTMKAAKALLATALNELELTAEAVKQLATKHGLTELSTPVNVVIEAAVDAAVEKVFPEKKLTRWEKARATVAVAAESLGFSAVKFEKRGKYQDWFITALDAEAAVFEQRLDVFRKKLREMK